MMHHARNYAHCIRSACQQEHLLAPETEVLCAALADPSSLQLDFEAFAAPILRDFPELKASIALLACYIARVDNLAEGVLPRGTPLPDLAHYASLDDSLRLVSDAHAADGGRDAPALRRWFSVATKLPGRVNGVKTHQKILNAIALLPETCTAPIQMGSGMTMATAARSLLVHHAMGTQPCKKPSRAQQVGAKRKRVVYGAYMDVARCLPSVEQMEEMLWSQPTTTHDERVAPLPPPSPSNDEPPASRQARTERTSTTASPLSDVSFHDVFAWTEEHAIRSEIFQRVSVGTFAGLSCPDETCQNIGGFTATMLPDEPESEKQPEEQPFLGDIELEALDALADDFDLDFLDCFDLDTFVRGFEESPSLEDGFTVKTIHHL